MARRSRGVRSSVFGGGGGALPRLGETRCPHRQLRKARGELRVQCEGLRDRWWNRTVPEGSAPVLPASLACEGFGVRGRCLRRGSGGNFCIFPHGLARNVNIELPLS